jgi:hypothetical protein
MIKNNQSNNTAPRLEVQHKMLKKFDVVSCGGSAGSTMYFGVVREVESGEPDLVWINPHSLPHYNTSTPAYKYTLIHEMDDIEDLDLRNAVTDVLHAVLTESD